MKTGRERSGECSVQIKSEATFCDEELKGVQVHRYDSNFDGDVTKLHALLQAKDVYCDTPISTIIRPPSTAFFNSVQIDKGSGSDKMTPKSICESARSEIDAGEMLLKNLGCTHDSTKNSKDISRMLVEISLLQCGLDVAHVTMIEIDGNDLLYYPQVKSQLRDVREKILIKRMNLENDLLKSPICFKRRGTDEMIQCLYRRIEALSGRIEKKVNKNESDYPIWTPKEEKNYTVEYKALNSALNKTRRSYLTLCTFFQILSFTCILWFLSQSCEAQLNGGGNDYCKYLKDPKIVDVKHYFRYEILGDGERGIKKIRLNSWTYSRKALRSLGLLAANSKTQEKAISKPESKVQKFERSEAINSISLAPTLINPLRCNSISLLISESINRTTSHTSPLFVPSIMDHKNILANPFPAQILSIITSYTHTILDSHAAVKSTSSVLREQSNMPTKTVSAEHPQGFQLYEYFPKTIFVDPAQLTKYHSDSTQTRTRS